MTINAAQPAGRDRVAALAVFLGVTFGAMALVSLPVSRFLPAPLQRIFGQAAEDAFLAPGRGITIGQAREVDRVLDRLLGSLERGVVEVSFPGGSGGSDGSVPGGEVAGGSGGSGSGPGPDGGDGGSDDGVLPGDGDGDGDGRGPAGPDGGGKGGGGGSEDPVIQDGRGRNFTGAHHDAPRPRIKGRYGTHGPEGSEGRKDRDERDRRGSSASAADDHGDTRAHHRGKGSGRHRR